MTPPVLSIPRDELSRLCARLGPFVKTPGLTDTHGLPLIGWRLLWALAGRESAFGANLKPRHEPAYDIGGRYYARSSEVRTMIAKWGRSFACSYGPLQVLAVNAPGFSPLELGSEPEKAMEAAVGFLNRYVIGLRGAATLEGICETWNGGHVGAVTTPGYFAEVAKHYAEAEQISFGATAPEENKHADK